MHGFNLILCYVVSTAVYSSYHIMQHTCQQMSSDYCTDNWSALVCSVHRCPIKMMYRKCTTAKFTSQQVVSEDYYY